MENKKKENPEKDLVPDGEMMKTVKLNLLEKIDLGEEIMKKDPEEIGQIVDTGQNETPPDTETEAESFLEEMKDLPIEEIVEILIDTKIEIITEEEVEIPPGTEETILEIEGLIAETEPEDLTEEAVPKEALQMR